MLHEPSGELGEHEWGPPEIDMAERRGEGAPATGNSLGPPRTSHTGDSESGVRSSTLSTNRNHWLYRARAPLTERNAAGCS